jgi:glucose/arabinose dehydrogenase
MLVSERWGDLKYLPKEPDGKPVVISGTPERPTEDHAGLMDVVLDPDFERNRTLYLSYVSGTRDAATVRILKARLDLETASLAGGTQIFESYPPAPGLEEFGGRMVIDRQGYLFLTLGDRYDRRHAQDLSHDYGKIIRINRDGSYPRDNPFIGTKGARPGIWTYGHRNPQGLALDPATGQLLAHEHGPQGGDEFNLIQAGRNYGWPIITYGREYDGSAINGGLVQQEGLEQPLRFWVPSIAPSGLAIYSGHVSEWQGKAWLGALAGQMLVRLTLENGRVVREEQFLREQVGRIRDVRTGPDGAIYFTTDSDEGSIYRVEPTEEFANGSNLPRRQIQ